MAGPDSPVSLDGKFACFDEEWSPKVVAECNGQLLKVAKVRGEFRWHSHADVDELFLVHRGRLVLRLRDRDVELGPGELFVVPKGVEHCPVADEGTELVLLEPAGVVNTGDGPADERTAPVDPWI
jgi:mannose-6-phosphate isomerase-like protein (cupin superfamily)